MCVCFFKMHTFFRTFSRKSNIQQHPPLPPLQHSLLSYLDYCTFMSTFRSGLMALKAPAGHPGQYQEAAVGGQWVPSKNPTNVLEVAPIMHQSALTELRALREKFIAYEAMMAPLHDALARSQQCQVLLEANLGAVNLEMTTRVSALSLEVACLRRELDARAIAQDTKFTAIMQGHALELATKDATIHEELGVLREENITLRVALAGLSLRPSPPRATTPSAVQRHPVAVLPGTTTKVSSPLSISPIRSAPLKIPALLHFPTWKVVKTLDRLELLVEGRLEGYEGAHLGDGVSWERDGTNRALLSELLKLHGLVKQSGGPEPLRKSKLVVKHYTLVGSGGLKLSSMARNTQYTEAHGYQLSAPPATAP
jgi:hypothetical protein